MKLNKRLKYAYDLTNYNFFIFDPLMNYIFQYESTTKYIKLVDILSDYDTEKTKNLNFISLDELIIDILANPKMMQLIEKRYEIWGTHSQDDLILICYKINYQNRLYTLHSDKYIYPSNLVVDNIYLEWPTDLIEHLNNIYVLSNIGDEFYF